MYIIIQAMLTLCHDKSATSTKWTIAFSTGACYRALSRETLKSRLKSPFFWNIKVYNDLIIIISFASLLWVSYTGTFSIDLFHLSLFMDYFSRHSFTPDNHNSRPSPSLIAFRIQIKNCLRNFLISSILFKCCTISVFLLHLFRRKFLLHSHSPASLVFKFGHSGTLLWYTRMSSFNIHDSAPYPVFHYVSTQLGRVQCLWVKVEIDLQASPGIFLSARSKKLMLILF